MRVKQASYVLGPGREPHWLEGIRPLDRAARRRRAVIILSRIFETVRRSTIILKVECDSYEGFPGLSRTTPFATCPGGGHTHTSYISCQQLLVSWPATTHTVWWDVSYGSHFSRKHTTTQPYSPVAPSQRWGRRGVVVISPESYRRLGPLLVRL